MSEKRRLLGRVPTHHALFLPQIEAQDTVGEELNAMPDLAPPDPILRHLSAMLGVALPPEGGAELAANYRLLLWHWARFGTPEKEPE